MNGTDRQVSNPVVRSRSSVRRNHCRVTARARVASRIAPSATASRRRSWLAPYRFAKMP
ncbi:hypothetical protein ACFSTI_14345 [Rhizorhabdus histidinilytica]